MPRTTESNTDITWELETYCVIGITFGHAHAIKVNAYSKDEAKIIAQKVLFFPIVLFKEV